MTNLNDIAQRKTDHIDIVLHKDVGFGQTTTGFENYRFDHSALPELALSDVDLSAQLFSRALKAPLLISSMTGGPDRAETINRHLIEAAQELGLAFAVGSQRIALEQQGAGGLNKDLRRLAPDIALIGNIGAAQIATDKGLTRAHKAIEMIQADGLFVHLNPLQEVIQTGGDTNWCGVLAAIEKLAKAGVPLAVKEVGFGLSAKIVQQLVSAGVSVIDVAGAGGTNWARVEGAREASRHALAQHFTEWGIPTSDALIAARKIAPDATIIASGGVKTGIDIAMAIRLGADLAGQAAGTLNAALKSTEAVITYFHEIIETLRITCFCTGSQDLAALKRAPLQSLTRP